MKWRQDHFDVIMILIMFCQDYRKKETMALDVITDGKNDEMEKND